MWGWLDLVSLFVCHYCESQVQELYLRPPVKFYEEFSNDHVINQYHGLFDVFQMRAPMRICPRICFHRGQIPETVVQMGWVERWLCGRRLPSFLSWPPSLPKPTTSYFQLQPLIPISSSPSLYHPSPSQPQLLHIYSQAPSRAPCSHQTSEEAIRVIGAQVHAVLVAGL